MGDEERACDGVGGQFGSLSLLGEVTSTVLPAPILAQRAIIPSSSSNGWKMSQFYCWLTHFYYYFCSIVCCFLILKAYG